MRRACTGWRTVRRVKKRDEHCSAHGRVLHAGLVTSPIRLMTRADRKRGQRSESGSTENDGDPEHVGRAPRDDASALEENQSDRH